MYSQVRSNPGRYITFALRGITRPHVTCPAMHAVDQAQRARTVLNAMQSVHNVLLSYLGDQGRAPAVTRPVSGEIQSRPDESACIHSSESQGTGLHFKNLDQERAGCDVEYTQIAQWQIDQW